MNWELLQIMVFVVVLVSIVGGLLSNIVERVVSYKKANLKAGSGDTSSGQVAALTAKTEMLEDRVRVLERIATDKDSSLAAEIEALRQLPDPMLEGEREKAVL